MIEQFQTFTSIQMRVAAAECQRELDRQLEEGRRQLAEWIIEPPTGPGVASTWTGRTSSHR
jgi:hypothetical protein